MTARLTIATLVLGLVAGCPISSPLDADGGMDAAAPPSADLAAGPLVDAGDAGPLFDAGDAGPAFDAGDAGSTPDAGDAGATLDAGDAGASLDGGPPLDVDGVSLEVTATFTGSVPGLGYAPTAYTFSVTLHDDPDPTRIDVARSMRGWAYPATFPRRGNVIDVDLVARPLDAVYTCTYVDMVRVDGTMTLLDTDGDGRADAATGSGSALVETSSGDLGFEPMGPVTLTAVRDTTAPTLAQQSEDGATVLLEHLAVYTSEAIPSSAWPVLDLGPGLAPRTFTPLDGTVDYASHFALATPDLLPFGAVGHVTSPALVDLAGNSGPVSLPITIAPDVGQLAETGFEEASPALVIDGNARIVTGLGTVGAVSGTRSLFVGASNEETFTSGELHGARVLARLAVAPGDTAVHATMRMVGYADSPTRIFDGRIELLSPAGDVVSIAGTDVAALTTTGAEPTGVPAYPSASDRVDVVLPLPPHVTDEVVLLLSTRTNDCGHPPLWRTDGLLVDDVRVE